MRTMILVWMCVAMFAGTIASAVMEPEEIPADWLSTVQQNITMEEYHVSWQKETILPDMNGSWQAPNRAHDLRTYFTNDGIRVVRRTEPEPSWEWSLSLFRIGTRCPAGGGAGSPVHT